MQTRLERMARDLAKAEGWDFTGPSMVHSLNPRAQKFVALARVAITSCRDSTAAMPDTTLVTTVLSLDREFIPGYRAEIGPGHIEVWRRAMPPMPPVRVYAGANEIAAVLAIEADAAILRGMPDETGRG